MVIACNHMFCTKIEKVCKRPLKHFRLIRLRYSMSKSDTGDK